jgi:hypothetical protein
VTGGWLEMLHQWVVLPCRVHWAYQMHQHLMIVWYLRYQIIVCLDWRNRLQRNLPSCCSYQFLKDQILPESLLHSHCSGCLYDPQCWAKLWIVLPICRPMEEEYSIHFWFVLSSPWGNWSFQVICGLTVLWWRECQIFRK